MFDLDHELGGAKTVAISGHVRPDGDCVGSTLAVLNYIKTYHPEIKADIYLDQIPTIFRFLANSQEIQNERADHEPYDVCIACDCGDLGRLGDSAKYFEQAKKTLCIDHHISNNSFADVNYVVPDASSTCELIYDLIGEEKIDTTLAECIYTGMVHDTGVFQYSCTSKKTMLIAGTLMEKGIAYSEIVDATFYTKSFEQNRILGKALKDAFLVCDGKMIVSILTAADLDEYHVTTRHLEGIVNQMRVTKGVLVSLFIYETPDGLNKASLRCNGNIDVNAMVVPYGGGGHVKAAGCSFNETAQEIVSLMEEELKKQLK